MTSTSRRISAISAPSSGFLIDYSSTLPQSRSLEASPPRYAFAADRALRQAISPPFVRPPPTAPTDASCLLLLAANDRQHAGRKEQIADLHRLRRRRQRRGRRGLRDRARPAVAPRRLAPSSGSPSSPRRAPPSTCNTSPGLRAASSGRGPRRRGFLIFETLFIGEERLQEPLWVILVQWRVDNAGATVLLRT